MVSFLNSAGKHLIVLAVSGLENVMTMIKNDEEGNVVMHVSLYHVMFLACHQLGLLE